MIVVWLLGRTSAPERPVMDKRIGGIATESPFTSASHVAMIYIQLPSNSGIRPSYPMDVLRYIKSIARMIALRCFAFQINRWRRRWEASTGWQGQCAASWAASPGLPATPSPPAAAAAPAPRTPPSAATLPAASSRWASATSSPSPATSTSPS